MNLAQGKHMILGSVQPPARTLATITTLFAASVSALVVTSFWAGLRSQAEIIVEAWENNIFIASYTSVRPDATGRLVQHNSLQWEDVELLRAALSGARAVSPVNHAYDTSVRHGERTVTATVVAAEPEYFASWHWTLADGAFFDEADLDRAALRCVLGSTVAQDLFETGTAVGERVTINGHAVLVTGVLRPKGRDNHGNDRDNDVVVPYTTGVKRLWVASGVRAIEVHVEHGQPQAPIAARAAELLRESHRIGLGKQQDFSILWDDGLRRRYLKLHRTKLTAAFLLASFAMVLSFIVISSTTATHATTRRVEYAVKRCVGATRGRVLGEVLGEVLALWIVACGLAIGVAAIGTRLVSSLTRLPSAQWSTFPLTMSLGAVVVAVVPSLIACTFGAIGPARRAARLEPASGLRD